MESTPEQSRIRRIMEDKGLTRDRLLERLAPKMGTRARNILYHAQKPTAPEWVAIAEALAVHVEELVNDWALTLGCLLREKGNYWRWERILPKLLNQTGLRSGKGTPDEMLTLCEDLLREDTSDQLENPDDEFPFWQG